MIIVNLAEMGRLTAVLSLYIGPGDFIALTGPLGSGKTTFSALLCQSWGVKDAVTSPTFALFNDYQAGSCCIRHGDLYRLTDAEIDRALPEWEESFFTDKSILILEWADKAPELQPLWTWHLAFSPVPDQPDARQLLVKSQKSEPLAQFQQDWFAACP